MELDEIRLLGDEGAPEEWLATKTGIGINGIGTEGIPDAREIAKILEEEPIPEPVIAATPEIQFKQCGSDHMTYGRSGCSIEYIVVHYTSGAMKDEGAAYANAVYFSRNENQGASAHYFIDNGYTIWQSVADTDTAWHAGNWNMNLRSIGIEVCTDWDYSEEEIQRLEWLVQMLMEKYGVPASKCIRHYDVTGKRCPAGYIEQSKWNALHARITEGKVKDRADITLWSAYDTPNQRWHVEWHGEWFALRNVASGLYLDVSNASKERGARVQVYKGNGSDAQLFKTEPIHGLDYYHPKPNTPLYIIPKCAEDLVLDVAGVSDTDGAKIQTWSRNGQLNQQWYLLDQDGAIVSIMSNMNGHRAIDVVNGGR